MVRRKRGDGIKREEFEKLINDTIDQNYTVLKILDEH